MLEACNIGFAYAKDRPVLDCVSLEVAPDDRLWISAPSGTGKTTLCRILAGYMAPDTGLVTVDGQPLRLSGRCQVQLIGQHPERALDPRMRLRDSVAEGGQLDDSLLEQLGIDGEWLGRFPHELSGGQLQRFCIARAIASEPRYLIADEISTMLDAVTQANIWKCLVDVCSARGIGMVFTTHSPALAARLATRKMCL